MPPRLSKTQLWMLCKMPPAKHQRCVGDTSCRSKLFSRKQRKGVEGGATSCPIRIEATHHPSLLSHMLQRSQMYTILAAEVFGMHSKRNNLNSAKHNHMNKLPDDVASHRNRCTRNNEVQKNRSGSSKDVDRQCFSIAKFQRSNQNKLLFCFDVAPRYTSSDPPGEERDQQTRE